MKKIFFLSLFFLILSCGGKKEQHDYGFYYWKTQLTLNSVEKKALEASTNPFLYVRFFDVGKIGNQFQPLGVATYDKSFKTLKKTVPTVFITNRSFVNITIEEIPFLAQQINDLISKKEAQFKFQKSDEIQIDCDWTAGTRKDYFEFLKQLKQISGKNISCTLRLHQVKDKAQTGIPPVSKVYLMCYSTSSPLENSDRNSILDVQTLKNYLSYLQNYPIKNIDVALPIYSWGIVTNHQGKHKLINALNKEDLNNPNFKKISENEVMILKDGFYFGNFLNEGFKIKVEEISNEQLIEVKDFLNKKLKKYNIVYYQLDSKFVKNRNFTF